MRKPHVFPRDQNFKIVQVRLSKAQYLTLLWLVEQGKGRSVANLGYMAVQGYVNTILEANPALANKLFKYLEKTNKSEPIFKITGQPFELIPQKATMPQQTAKTAKTAKAT